ncbi:MAG TPA: MFS transporter [Ohtaekwangia sp.]
MNTATNITTAGTDKISARCWVAFGICVLSNMLGGTVSTIMSVYLPTVVHDLLGDVTPQRINDVSAYINALYIVGWTIGGFTWGFISDQIGRAKALVLAIGFFGVFTILIAFLNTWEAVVAFRMLDGFGVGGVLVISATYLSEIFPERLRSIVVGILSIGFPIGIFSAGLVNYIVADWRQGFWVGILPVVLAILSVGLLQESEKWKNRTVISTHEKITLGGNLDKIMWGSLIFGSMLIGLWAIFSWVPTWIQSLLANADAQKERGLSMMLLGAGGLTGGFISGWVANALGIRKSMIICFTACLILSFLLFKVNTSFSSIIYGEIALLALFFGMSQGLLSVYIPGLFPTRIRATATGICFNLGRLFTAAAVFFVGALVTTLGGYGNAIFIFSLVFLIGLVAIFFTKTEINPHSES